MTTLLSKTLFNLDTKNKVRQWSISVTQNPDDTATITVSQGLKGGNLTDRSTHITTGKNIGRANETTPAQQAVSEAESKIASQMQKEGYAEHGPQWRFGLNGMGLLRPMNALEYKKAKGLTPDTVVHIQPKLDGFRMKSMIRMPSDNGTGELVMYTREGCRYEIEEVVSKMRSLLAHVPSGITIDAELYSHELTFQEISSAAKKAGKNTDKLKLFVYDLSDGLQGSDVMEFPDRYALLCDLLGEAAADPSSPIELVPTVRATVADWDNIHAEFISMGYEGSIGRLEGFPYQPAGRDKRMIKRKDFHDEEFEIVGIDRTVKPAPTVSDVRQYPEGSLVTMNESVYACQAQFICKTSEGNEFKATLEGGVLSRAKLYAADDSDYVGKLATCKYFEMTDDGIPRHPIARRRDEL